MPALNGRGFCGRLETNVMCRTKNSLHLALEVRFPGCYVMMVADHNLMICTPTKMDKKLISHGEFTQKSNLEPVIEENKRFFLFFFYGFLRLRKIGNQEKMC